MKKILLLAGLLILTGCSAEKPFPLYETNKAKFIEIKTQLRDCMQQAVDTDYYALDRIRSEVQSCDQTAFDQLLFKKNPETFYIYGTKNGSDPFDDFSFCSSSLANGMWDFPPEATTPSFRKIVQDCINQFPGAEHKQTPDWDSRLLKRGDKFDVLLMDDGKETFQHCEWAPTATNYAEDARCTIVR